METEDRFLCRIVLSYGPAVALLILGAILRDAPRALCWLWLGQLVVGYAAFWRAMVYLGK